jgi:hypothetical protein
MFASGFFISARLARIVFNGAQDSTFHEREFMERLISPKLLENQWLSFRNGAMATYRLRA